ncbi:hypothetical protein CLAFUW4_05647 [Fulvia fulva]|nr:hypothetical protein CLAFUR4_05642 [Fulvia fulva]WPV14454.1 hypothetical protein CLAFUW4_05647 [Fulvia fulva]WPV29782.1 hypothetical protein CLAFUW7_05646 [Fulvia fulva]
MSHLALITVLPDPTSILTLQNAVHRFASNLENGQIELYRNGCEYRNETGSFTDCTIACQQPATVWDSMEILHNCASYSAVSQLLSSGYADDDTAQLALGMGYVPDFNLSLVYTPIDECVHSFCHDVTTDKTCTHQSLESVNDTQNHSFVASDFIHAACGAIKASPNVDVGGIGVYAGYLMQLSILIYAYLHSRLVTTWIRAVVFATHRPLGLEIAQRRAEAVQDRLDSTYQQPALISGLADFQKAQSFFSITLEGAAIGALASNGRIFDATSLQQLHLTAKLLGDVATAGVLCVTFGLYLLHANDCTSWYTSTVSILAVLVSVAAWIQTRLPLQNLRNPAPSEHNLPACGGRSPTTYCLETSRHKNTAFEAVSIGLCVFIMLVLMTRQSKAVQRFGSALSSRKPSVDAEKGPAAEDVHLHRVLTMTSTASKAVRLVHKAAATKVSKKVYNWREEIAEFVFANLIVNMLVILVKNGAMTASRQEARWTFGQLIAVTIWAPSIIEHVYGAVQKWSLRSNTELKTKKDEKEEEQVAEAEAEMAAEETQKRQLHASQQRYATARKSPSTQNRLTLQERHALTLEEARQRRGAIESLQMERWVDKAVTAGEISVTTKAAMDFLRAFEALLAKSRGRPTVDPDRFNSIKAEYALSGNDCFYLGRLLLIGGPQDERFNGRKLIISLSRAGNVEATLYVMANAVQQQKTKPTTLKSMDVQYPRATLTKIAAEGKNYRAMVLEGRLALALGDEERAIDLWTRAMAAAVEAAEEGKQRSADKPRLSFMEADRQKDPYELNAPWIELMMLHYERSKFRGKDEWTQCQWAMEIGCEQDDPVSHYYASTFAKREDEYGNHIPESGWLYHVTKAATSGHQKAMHELGEFYAQSGWKYINDEPPDYLKPTPFDSYPAPASSMSLLDSLKSFAGINTPSSAKASDHIFGFAAFPNTALARWSLALEWLDQACSYGYAPSYMMKAHLHMQETLWYGADTPQSALTLSPDRYDYASKEQYDIQGPHSRPTPEGGPPNPYYNIETVKTYLRHVFYAHQAHGYVAKAQEEYASKRRRGLTSAATDEDDIISESALSKLPWHIRRWFRFPEVREMYEGQIEALLAEAKGICDDHGWDILNDDGTVVYKAIVSKR